MKEVFRPAGDIRINTKSSYRKLNHPFKKKQKNNRTRQNNLLCIGPFLDSRSFKENRTFEYTSKHKIKYYYLNDLPNQIYKIFGDSIMF